MLGQAAVILPGGQATPDDTQPNSVTPSPGFLHDGIAFFTADDVASCPGGNGCPTLYRTQDGGATWTRLWSSTYRGGDVLLSPQFPADPTIFVLDPKLGLQSGTAADAAPSEAVPGAVAAAIAPDSTAGHARIAAVSGSGVVFAYTAGDLAPVAGPKLPPGITANAVAFTGPDQVVVVGFDSPTPLVQQAVLVRCTLSSSCSGALPVPADMSLYLAPGATEGGPLVLWSMQRVYVSTDGGASVRQIASAAEGRVIEAAALGPGPAGTRILLSDSDAATQRGIGVSYSDDLGATFITATGNLAGSSGALMSRVLGDGELLVGLLTSHAHFAMDHSSGDGVWKAA